MNVLTQWWNCSVEILMSCRNNLPLNALNSLIKCLNLILIYIFYACSFPTLVHIINWNIVLGEPSLKTTCILKKS